MKIVINKGYRSFQVSTETLKELVKINSDCIRKITPKQYYGEREDWEKQWREDSSNYVDIGDGFTTDEFMGYYIYKEGFLYGLISKFENDSFRSNKEFIDIIEKLGDRANTEYSTLKIIDIPDGVKYYIYEDESGEESIHEEHRSWF